jgi:Tfp pilus assembly protein PilF
VHQLLAESYQAQENTASAEEEYLAALQAAPESPEVLNSLGDLKRLQFKFDEAITYYARAAAIRPRDYVSAYGLGACYLYLHKPERAVEYLRRALAIEPDSAPARLALGDALLRAGAADEAVTELKAAVAVRPDMRQAYTLLARAYRRLGHSREAEEALRKSNELAEAESRARQELLSSDDLDIGASAPDSAAPPPAGPKE